MKNYINGTSEFQFKIIHPDASSEILNFSFRFKSLTEYEDPISILHNYADGTSNKLSLFHHKEFVLDYSEYFQRDDALKIQIIKNAELDGSRIFITPHIDEPSRCFEVYIIDEKRPIGTHYKQVNKDYIIAFRTVKPQFIYDWSDPNISKVTSAVTCEEF